MMRCFALFFALVVPFASMATAADDLPERASAGLQKAVQFFRERASTEGGYVWKYASDLSRREGERPVEPSMVWIQPPGTPSVGRAYLQAYQICEEPYLLQAAIDTGHALVRGQLLSGGWDYSIEFDASKRHRYAYRVDGEASAKARNVTTLDDNNTQEVLRFLMELDTQLKQQDGEIHGAVEYALAALLQVQYPNGAWPQRFSAPPDADQYPVQAANYPDRWSREWPGSKYQGYYTFNDGAIADVIDVMFQAAETYGDERYRQAARRGGDFILLAQMPEPQPAWAQQYNAQMQPDWARKFEPPSVTGGESQGALSTLLQVYRETGDKKYLEPVPRAVAYLRSSLRADGRLARFYELKTNKPLYFTKDYQLTYSDADMPTHYGFIVGSKLDRIEAEYQRVLETPPEKLKPARRKPSAPQLSGSLANQAEALLAAMDERRAWVEEGKLKYADSDDSTDGIIDSRTFARNLIALARYVGASKAAAR